MACKIFANLTIGTDNLTSKQKLVVQNFIHEKFDALPVPGISNQWHFPIEAYFSEASDKVQIVLAELTAKLKLDKLIYTLYFSTEKWKTMELSVEFCC